MRNYQTIKWLFVFIVLMAINTFNAMGQTTVVFDFTSAEWLKSVGITPPAQGAGTNITSKSILYEGITMTSTKGTENARIWNKDGNLDFRIYKDGGSVTFTASQDYNITEIVFTGTIKSITVLALTKAESIQMMTAMQRATTLLGMSGIRK